MTNERIDVELYINNLAEAHLTSDTEKLNELLAEIKQANLWLCDMIALITPFNNTPEIKEPLGQIWIEQRDQKKA